MNSCYNYTGCGCNAYPTFPYNPIGCGGCNMMPYSYGYGGGFSSGSTWFAIVLVVFLLLIICGCTKIC